VPVAIDRVVMADRRLTQAALAACPWLAKAVAQELAKFYQRMPGAGWENL
jgi:hypothetical protein